MIGQSVKLTTIRGIEVGLHYSWFIIFSDHGLADRVLFRRAPPVDIGGALQHRDRDQPAVLRLDPPPRAGEIWDIVHYVQSLRVRAHEQELLAAGMKPADRERARTQLWAALSAAARRGELDEALVRFAPGQSPATEAKSVLPNQRRDP